MNDISSVPEGRKALLKLVSDAVVTAAEGGDRLALMCVDVDNFKDINFSVG